MADTDTLGQFTTCVPPVPEEYDPVYLEQILNEIMSNLNMLAQAVWLETYGTAIGDRTPPGATTKSADYTIVEEDDNGVRFSNADATLHIVFSMPAATTDLEFEFSIDSDYDIYLEPASGEKFQLGDTDDLMKPESESVSSTPSYCIPSGELGS